MKKYLFIIPILFLICKCDPVSSDKGSDLEGINIRVTNSGGDNLKDVKIYIRYNFVDELPKPSGTASVDSVEYGQLTYQINTLKQVVLNWTTLSEASNYGFYIERRKKDSFDWIELGFVAGSGSTSIEVNYTFTDINNLNGIYYYRLKQVDTNADFEYSNELEVIIVTLPGNYQLLTNSPNPFNQNTVLRFMLPERSTVRLTLRNIKTEAEIATLQDNTLEAGFHSIQFLSADVIPNGVYYLNIEATSLIGAAQFNDKILMCKNNSDEQLMINDTENYSTGKDGIAEIEYTDLPVGKQIETISGENNISGNKFISKTLNLILIKSGYVSHTEPVVIDSLGTINLNITLTQ
jgi:hypothetical protein